MPSLLSRIGSLAIPAAAARGSYIAGKTEGEARKAETGRQSMLDKMQAALQGAQLKETQQRGEYYEGLSSDNWAEDSQGNIFNRRSGEQRRGAGKPPTTHGEEHYDPERDEVGFTVMNADGTMGWKKTRGATRIDKMKYDHVPRDGSEPPPEQPGVGEGRAYEAKKKKADDLVSSYLATHDLEDLTAENLQVFAGRILTNEERSALGRARTPPAADRAFSIPPISRPKVTPRDSSKATAPPKKTDNIRSVEFYPVGGAPKDSTQEEVDKAALRRAHPEMSEAQVTALLARLRSRPPL